MKELVGRRGAALLILALIQVTIGWSILAAPVAAFRFLPILNALPQTAVAWIVIGLGIAVVPFAFLRRGDATGFNLAIISPTVFGLSFFLSSVTGEYPMGGGYALRQAAYWFGYALLPLVISGMIGVAEVRRSARGPDNER